MTAKTLDKQTKNVYNIRIILSNSPMRKEDVFYEMSVLRL